MRRSLVLATIVAVLTSLFGTTAVLGVDPQRTQTRPVPSSVDELRLDGPITTSQIARPTTLDASLRSATGIRQVVVQLSEPAVSEVAAAGATSSAQRQALRTVDTQQNGFIAAAGARVLGQTEVALNAVALEVDASRLSALAADPRVVSIRPVIDYELALSETVPYIGASDVHGDGITGAGVSVAVLDSGIDYTHAAFGGAGTAAAYNAAYGADTGDPANKDLPNWATIGAATGIVGGFDFVGEVWPFGGLLPDPDPIDCGAKPVDPQPPDAPATCEGGHGTHVADIIGGEVGVAPDADLYAVKVCSAVSSACSGVALLLGYDFALDPDADGDTSDHVDVVNMSLGSLYGTAFEDDLSAAVDAASEVGVLTVSAAGNGSDKPYVADTPGNAPTALSVAQTNVPSAILPLMEVLTPAALAGTYVAVHQPWSDPFDTLISAPLFHDDSTDGRRLGCRLDGGGASDPSQPNPFEGDDFSGRIVIVDRGACDFSEKIANIALAGAEAGIIGLVAPGEPFGGALGICPGDACDDIPGFMIAQEISEDLQAAATGGGASVEFDPTKGLPLVGEMVGSSSRGPTMLTNIIKPEIGAPGASVSAQAGTGTDTVPFGGTSGATPMVTGSAALLLEAYPGRSPAEIKSVLMNYAETDIDNSPPELGGGLAPISRIGGGEVRVNDAHGFGDLAAWDTEAGTAALSFGFVDASDATTTLTREVTVHNYGGAPRTLDIASDFRFADDAESGAVEVSAPASVMVPAGGEASFDVTLTVHGAALPDWTLNSGENGANGDVLTDMEFDGYLTLSDGSHALHLAWHVLPRLSGETTASGDVVVIDEEFEGIPSGSLTLNNAGVGLTAIDGYSWLAQSPVLPSSQPGDQLPVIDLQYAGIATIPVPPGICLEDESFVLLLASTTWERQTHANAPASFEWDIDTTGDGAPDFAVFNFDLNGDLSDGRNVAFALDLETGDASAFFATDHATNSGNTVQIVCAEQIGLTINDLGTPLAADLFAVDIYFTGLATDVITDINFAPLGERYFPIIGGDGFGVGDVPAGGSASLDVLDFGAAGTNPGELGVLLLTDGTRVNDALDLFKTGAPQPNEAIAIAAQAGPPEPPPPGLPFEDIEDSPFVNDIVWAFDNGITAGCSLEPPLYCPDDPVTREQMASFLVRAYDLPPAAADHFSDDETSVHEGAINALFESGITAGCGGTKFCPKLNVTREQMASFLARAEELPGPTGDHFTDDETSSHEGDINRLFEAGITGGCGGTKFCPKAVVSRGQMAAFLHRALD